MSRDEQWGAVARAMSSEKKIDADAKAFTGSDAKVAADALRLAEAKRKSADELEALARKLTEAKR